MNITDIYEAMNGKAESFFEWAQAHPKIGLLFAAGSACPMVRRHIAPLEVGVSLAVRWQAVAVR